MDASRTTHHAQPMPRTWYEQEEQSHQTHFSLSAWH